jgi:hypothetical protein
VHEWLLTVLLKDVHRCSRGGDRGSRLCVVICVQGSGHREGLKVLRSICVQGSGHKVFTNVHRGPRLCVVICVQGSGHREGLKVVRSDLCSRKWS